MEHKMNGSERHNKPFETDLYKRASPACSAAQWRRWVADWKQYPRQGRDGACSRYLIRSQC